MDMFLIRVVMMNDEIQQALLDALTQHNAYLQRLSSNAVNQILRRFDKLTSDALNDLLIQLNDLTDSELNVLISGRYTTASLKNVQGVITGLQQSLSMVLPEIFALSGVALATYEASYIYKLADKKSPVISGESLLKKAGKTPYAGGQLLDYIFPRISQNLRNKIEYTIRDGVSNGQTNQQIIQRIKGTKKLNYADGLLNQSRNVIDSEVKTARAHISSNVYLDIWKALGFDYVRDVATLDGRTSLYCASIDGRVQKADGTQKKPPYHYRCRTVPVGCDKDGKLDGIRPFVADNRPVKDIPKDQRDGKIGTIDANQTYKQWFARQDDTFQRNLLGKTRFELYKSGEFPIDKFVDPLSGKKFTIAELRQMDEQTFKELGL